jgi:tRNA(Ile)-lysidine synthase
MSPSLRMTARQSRSALRLEKRVAGFIARRGVLRHGERIIIGVSGGPDSTALLCLLSLLRSRFRLRLTAAHFDHRLRSLDEASGDRAFVERICRSLRVPLVIGRGDTKRRASREGESIEEAARNLRYAFFGREAKAAGATAVAIGHTLDDRAETVLLHLIRGSGLDGLAAMPPRSPWPFGEGPDIARPLLDLSREEVERYCAELGVEPRRDPSNDLPVATRNRVRNELMPVLRSFNPRAAEALARLADSVTGDSDLLESLAAAEFQRLRKTATSRRVVLARQGLAGLPMPVAVRVLRLSANAIGARPETVHLRRATEVLAAARGRVSIPGGLIAVGPDAVVLSREEARRAQTGAQPRQLDIPGGAWFGGWAIEAVRAERDAARPRDPLAALLDVDAIDGPLVVRSRRPGDRLRPLGLGGSKKLQDILVDAKVPSGERDSVPIIADRLGIVWVAGQCIDERVAVSGKTRRVVRLRARRKRAS